MVQDALLGAILIGFGGWWVRTGIVTRRRFSRMKVVSGTVVDYESVHRPRVGDVLCPVVCFRTPDGAEVRARAWPRHALAHAAPDVGTQLQVRYDPAKPAAPTRVDTAWFGHTGSAMIVFGFGILALGVYELVSMI